MPNETESKDPVTVKTVTKKASSKKRSKKRKRNTQRSNRIEASQTGPALFPRHSVDKALRIPRAILEQNAGKECSESEAAGYLGLKLNGPVRVEISSALKRSGFKGTGDLRCIQAL